MTKVLVIDDCEELRMVVEDLLNDLGMSVVSAEDVRSGWKFLEEQEFDLVLCDLVLPMPLDEADAGMEDDSSPMVGVHAIHELSKRFPKMPIVAISGELVGEPLKAIRQFGAMTTLSKPFGRDELQAAVEYALVRECEQVKTH